jgi:methylphosphotriester-DNA--protein-cysteine methyltransferase
MSSLASPSIFTMVGSRWSKKLLSLRSSVAMAAMAQFKAVTAMSPQHSQKQIRLQEARRLMINDLDAASAGHRVGYDDASHFTREYKRVFGEPPLRDVQRLRGVAVTPAAL